MHKPNNIGQLPRVKHDQQRPIILYMGTACISVIYEIIGILVVSQQVGWGALVAWLCGL